MARLSEDVLAVGFDLDGTLVDTVPDLETAANALLGVLGAPPLGPGRVRELVGDGIGALVGRVLRAGLDQRTITPSLEARALERFRSLYRQHLF
ncbi:MAG TPA: hypothetical protein VLV29_06670, partial [Steroidobacteraceae bacterium]|nr:hypothetical protein [Steroidobacteraceae bacterium]